jgi:hypothetical protein
MTLAPPIAHLPSSERAGRILDLLLPCLVGLQNRCSGNTGFDLTESAGGLHLKIENTNVAGGWMRVDVDLASADEIASGAWRSEVNRRMTDAFSPFAVAPAA